MYVPFHDDGIISQFEGYDALAELDWAAYRRRYGDIQRLDLILEAEGDSPNRYKLSKQADVVMLFYLFSADELGELFARLGYPFNHDTIPNNVNYYVARTSYGSTLCRVVYSWVLARSDRPRSMAFFAEALQSDVSGQPTWYHGRGHPSRRHGRHGRPGAAGVDGDRGQGGRFVVQSRIAAGNGGSGRAHPVSRAFA